MKINLVKPQEVTAYLDESVSDFARSGMTLVMGILRAQSLSYQTSHWQTKGPTYYGNHLLFGKLYESVEGEIDSFGEKMVGYFGVESVDLLDSLGRVTELASRWHTESDHFRRGLVSERELQSALAYLRNGWPATRSPLPLGLDDWLAATANAHETNVYLLQQIVDGR